MIDERSTVDKFWDVATKAAVAIAVALAGWVVSIDRRVGTIEATRFSRDDWHRESRNIIDRIEVGPRWLKQDIEALKELSIQKEAANAQRMDQIDTQLRAIWERLSEKK